MNFKKIPKDHPLRGCSKTRKLEPSLNRSQLDQAVQNYLAAGKKIQKLKPFGSAESEYEDFHTATTPTKEEDHQFISLDWLEIDYEISWFCECSQPNNPDGYCAVYYAHCGESESYPLCFCGKMKIAISGLSFFAEKQMDALEKAIQVVREAIKQEES